MYFFFKSQYYCYHFTVQTEPKKKSDVHKTTLKFTPTAVPQGPFYHFHTLFLLGTSPHLFRIASEMLRLWDFFSFLLFALTFTRKKSPLSALVSSCQPESQGLSNWFCSSDTCHPVSSLPEVCFLSPLSPYKDWCLRLTGHCYIPTYLFSLSLLLYTNVGEISFF